ncbi:phosphate ABC transporter substrate-binding protein PstS family protein [Vagococcus coleopterorum]|uniref:Phosphate-binding protein n=1 Tax=Vagococcus coleopterorum TaxID=2714946 RepID=A0A6G8AN14_9ENTE|nr:phosphate ABC transporter substrate-binding protein PstS family protein [Vagococcus coleopterorum]QIL46471.1 phosphate ABC transporter substrate-binding protein PstS family protein [Vagococcus coleopterorum]
MKKFGLLLASVFLLTGCGAKLASTTAVGSTALQPLVEAGAHDFMQQHKGRVVNVQGGGSGTGLSQVQAGAVEIGNSDVFADEKKGIKAEQLVDYKVAVIGIAPVVNPNVGVTDISKSDLKGLFSGEITNWKDLGGKDLPVIVINRSEGSGTRLNFEKYGLDNIAVKPSQEQEANGMTREIVSQTPGAVSYMALPYIDQSVRALAIEGVEASVETIATNQWSIWSYEHMYTQLEVDELTQEFIDHMMSHDIQEKVFKKLGYIPIANMKVERDSLGEVTEVKGGETSE